MTYEDETFIEYTDMSDTFLVHIRDHEMVLNTDEMKAMIETGLYAIALRYQITKETTL